MPLAADVRASLEGFAGPAGRRRGPRGGRSPCPCPWPKGSARGRSWCCPSSVSGLPDDAYASFAELDAVPGDDPMLVAGRALAGRYRTWARANGRRQHQRAAWAACFERYDVVLAPVMPTAAFPHDVERPMTRAVHRRRRHTGVPPRGHGLVRGRRFGAPAGGDPAHRVDPGRSARRSAGDRTVSGRPSPVARGRAPRRRRRIRLPAAPALRAGGRAGSSGPQPARWRVLWSVWDNGSLNSLILSMVDSS